jgi:hypothetical protein
MKLLSVLLLCSAALVAAQEVQQVDPASTSGSCYQMPTCETPPGTISQIQPDPMVRTVCALVTSPRNHAAAVPTFKCCALCTLCSHLHAPPLDDVAAAYQCLVPVC